MHFGLFMECDYREGSSQQEAFAELFAQAEASERHGLDAVWLAELHFAAPTGQPNGMVRPSVASAPLVIASAIAARTQTLRIGVAVNVLPLAHPVRLAEEAATVDNISQGRLDFGVGRSISARAYSSYGIPYEENRERFQECLEVIMKAWTSDRFSYEGQFFRLNDVSVMPRPYQKPHPPIRVAVTTSETFARVGRLGFPIFVGLRGIGLSELADLLRGYREAWKEGGHPGEGDALLRIPVYVAQTQERAHSEAEESTMLAFTRAARNFARSQEGTVVSATDGAAGEDGTALGFTYDDLLKDRVAYGTPEAVVERLNEIQQQLQLSGFIVEMNSGGLIPQANILNSLRLFGEHVIPKFS